VLSVELNPRGRKKPRAGAAPGLLGVGLVAGLSRRHLEEGHPDDRLDSVLPGGAQPGRSGFLLLEDLVERFRLDRRDPAPAAQVEPQRRAAEVPILAPVEDAGGKRGRRIGHQRFDHVSREGAADGRVELLPIGVVDHRSLRRFVEMGDRAAHVFLFHDLDQAQALELPHVVADVAERDVDLLGDFLRTGDPFGEDRQRLDSDRVAQGLE
jgi:hypothetical protein